ncbi:MULTISPECIES: DUF6039 family protein [Streptomyces]|uniref:DUF6039 family protein n=1 Tax=Streptomyces TaxID=1883 RepID=UPI000692141E|nr:MULTISPECIES: DUF6039 family protein [Streptomyces]
MSEELHSANAGVIVHRTGQLRGGLAGPARQAARDAVEYLNAKHAGIATVQMFEETFGVRDKLHLFMYLRSLSDYETLTQAEGDICGGVFGNPKLTDWDRLFVEGTVQDTVAHPHRWGIHGTLTEAMAADPSVNPNVDGPHGPTFVVTPAEAQTAQEPGDIVHSGNCGILMRRTAEFNYSYRDEARVFARTIAENVNLCMAGHASVFLYEEDFGPMDRVHWYIHMKSMDVYYALMGLDARTDENAPRASYLQDWISMDKGGGSWDKMLVQGSVRDLALTPRR